jgi:hypothetical protein
LKLVRPIIGEGTGRTVIGERDEAAIIDCYLQRNAAG